MGVSDFYLRPRLGDVGADRGRYLALPSSAGALRCRSLLADLIRAQAGAQAESISAALIDRFGSMAAALAAPARDQREIAGLSPTIARQLKLLRSAQVHMVRRPIGERSWLGQWSALIAYLQVQAHCPVEEVRVIFLNSRNNLIREEVMWRGTIDQAPVYTREVVRRALELHAAALIISHNHPSGDPKPSRADIEMTRLLSDAGKRLGITVHDHLIIAPGRCVSLKSEGLI